MPLVLLAQSSAAVKSAREVWVWGAILLAVLVVLAIVAWVVRRRSLGGSAPSNSNPDLGFTLNDLRQLRQSGQLSEEEYQRARTLLLIHTPGSPLSHPEQDQDDEPDSGQTK